MDRTEQEGTRRLALIPCRTPFSLLSRFRSFRVFVQKPAKVSASGLPLAAALMLLAHAPACPAAPSPAGGTAGVLRKVLPNGLTVLAEARHAAPVVTVMMWY